MQPTRLFSRLNARRPLMVFLDIEDNSDPAFRLDIDAKHKARKAEGKARKRSKRNPLFTKLRRWTSRLNYGETVPGFGKVRPELTNLQVIDRYNKGHNGKKRYGASLNDADYQDHLDRKATYFYYAAHETNNPEILLSIDVDVKDNDTAACQHFINLLKAVKFPDLYSEPSTGGKGIHAYLVVQKQGKNSTDVRAAAMALDRYCKELAAQHNIPIKVVEVKGLPPVIKYNSDGSMRDYTAGIFCKLPRSAEVLTTTRVPYNELAFLDPSDVKVIPQYAIDAGVSSSLRSDEQGGGTPLQLPKPLRVGSSDTRVVTQDLLDTKPAMIRLGRKLMKQWWGSTTFKVDRWTITDVDVAETLIVLAAMKPNGTEAMPARRIATLWTACVQAGDFERGFNYHRFMTIRNMVSKHGHVDWIDNRYQNVKDGKGRACRWRLSEWMISLIRGGASSVDTQEQIPDGPYQHQMPKWYNFTLEREIRVQEWQDIALQQLFAA